MSLCAAVPSQIATSASISCRNWLQSEGIDRKASATLSLLLEVAHQTRSDRRPGRSLASCSHDDEAQAKNYRNIVGGVTHETRLLAAAAGGFNRLLLLLSFMFRYSQWVVQEGEVVANSSSAPCG